MINAQLKQVYLVSVCLVVNALSAHANCNTIDIFTLSSDPIRHMPDTGSTQLCELDRTDRLQKNILTAIKASPKSLDWSAFQRQYSTALTSLTHATQCQYRAKTLGITKLPAIVINSRDVFYGERDMDSILIRYEQERHT